MRIIRLCLLMILLPTLAQATELSVFAASSLTEVLQAVAQAYQTQHPADKIVLNFAGSQSLATQIEQSAPADLFIAANTAAMDRLLNKGLVENPRTLLQNQLVLAIQPELKAKITSIKDLARYDLLLVIGNRQVPVGKYTRRLFANLAADPEYGPEVVQQIEKKVVSQENMVKAIVAKLLLGEADAGIVYQSDLSADSARKLVAVPIPSRHNPLATYPVAMTTGRHADCTKLVEFLFSPEAQQLFTRYGFLTGARE
ncbi:molybdate ABC transporter substrate-binding protein [Geopsychrobacter electrodiphilus]|uniref:molybdate ABC transporter substrate-binding protein n=1 Tax=Geopsychrobacter electrodiphilus TaxID=225196 RepID=UPI00037A6335|nr:molybdate ABC transporter substrate-binding protein [Geopsychrobacter electrodiphilus]